MIQASLGHPPREDFPVCLWLQQRTEVSLEPLPVNCLAMLPKQS